MNDDTGQDDSSPTVKSMSSEFTRRVIDVLTLFAGSREIELDFAGVRYRLRITRRNKLILQK